MSIFRDGKEVQGNFNNPSEYIKKTSIVDSVDENSTNEHIPGAKLLYQIQDECLKMNETVISPTTDGSFVIGQEYTVSEAIIPHKLSRLQIYWRKCPFTRAEWYSDDWGYIDGHTSEYYPDSNIIKYFTIRVLIKSSDYKTYKILYSKSIQFDLATNTFTIGDITEGFNLSIFK